MRLEHPPISALVVAHNEEANLAACLPTLAFCSELVVVLDRCEDGSRAVAERFGARIVEGAWPLEGPRRHAGIEAANGPWILEVDADERVPPALAEEILKLLAEDAFDYFIVPFDNFVGSRLVRHGWGAQFGVGGKTCLYRKGCKRWGAQRVHPKLVYAPGARRGPMLQARMQHYVDRNISDLLRRLDRYSTARARDLRDSGEIGSAFEAYRRLPSRFWKCFVARKGYREGGLGFLIALAAGLYPLLSYLKARYEEEERGDERGAGP